MSFKNPIPENMMPETCFEEIGDITLQYLKYEGDDPTVIFLHATGFLPMLWHPIVRKLNLPNKVIAPYFCDHREPSEKGTAWITLAEDLAGLCRKLNIKNPVLAGHSMGATIMVLAESLFHVGARGIVLIEPIMFPRDYYRMADSISATPLVEKTLKRRNSWEDPAQMKEYLKTKDLFSNWKEEFLDLYVEYGTVRKGGSDLELTCPPPREADLFKGSVSLDPWPLLPDIKCPVVVVEGEKSGNRSLIDLSKIASTIPGGRLSVVKNAGHLVPMEQPEATVEIIRSFISSLT